MKTQRHSRSQVANKTVHQLKISLRDIRPSIWRRVLVPSQIRLSDLHAVIIATMPWLDYHLHQFIIAGANYGAPSPDDADFGLETLDERTVTLAELAAAPKNKFLYEYDFGDDWFHEIRVEKILPFDPMVKYPLCIAGKRCVPPEDCGGPYGYNDLLQTLSNPKNAEYKEMKRWAESLLGHKFDPEYFDIKRINKRLHKHIKLSCIKPALKRKILSKWTAYN